MQNQFERTELLLGSAGVEKLRHSRVAVFGVGGVGGHVVEALCRSGVGTLDLIDNDQVVLSNLNRQIIATRKTIGQYKVDAARERILDINPEAVVNCFRTFFMPETCDQFDFKNYDYVVDAIDTVTGKLALAEKCAEAGTPLISSMGAGNKLEPSLFQVADIYETSVCPLAKVMRRELKKRGIKKLKVVYSKEQPLTPILPCQEADPENTSGLAAKADTDTGEEPVAIRKRQTPGSTAFVPAVAGLIIAGEVVKDLVRQE